MSGNPRPTETNAASSVTQPPRSQRVLACVLCQQRKVKCDRKFPCVNCVKAGAQCVPAALVRRPRKRRFPERELLDRLHQYENLLRQNKVSFEPLHGVDAKENPNSKVEALDCSDDEDLTVSKSHRPSPSSCAKPEPVPEAKEFWHTLKQVFRDQFNDNDTSKEVERDPGAMEAWNQAFGASDNFLLGSRKAKLDISFVHPDPTQIFKLWQVYLNNVDPLLKATHSPSLQARIVEAMGNITVIDNNLEALIFSVYCVSVRSLGAGDCLALFGWSKEDLLSRYQFGCQQALSNSNFLQTDDRDCLTALYLYLVSVSRHTHPRALSSMLGAAIRIAQRMGLDSEVICAKLPPFEAEINRRLWWSLMLFDSRLSELAGHKPSMLSPVWDCGIPLNINDSDIRPEIKEPPKIQGKTTEAVFAVVRSEVANFTRRTMFHIDFTNPALRPLVHDACRSPEREALNAFEKSIEKQYLRFCDQENPLHFMTIWTTRAQIAKLRLTEHHSTFSSPSARQTEAQYNNAMSYAFNILDYDTKLLTSPLTKPYLWLLDYHFPFLAYVHIIQDLRRRPASKHVHRAWEVMSDNYEARFSKTPSDDNPVFNFFAIFTKTIDQTWKDRETRIREHDELLITPRIISSIRFQAEQTAQGISNSALEHPSLETNVGTDSLPLSTTTGFGGLDNSYCLGERDAYTGGTTGFYLDDTEQATLDGEMNQIHWTPM